MTSLLHKILFPLRRVSAETLTKEVQGTVLLITGASYGIGEALAHRVASAGAHLILVARTADRLEQLAAVLSTSAASVQWRSVDLRCEEEVADLIDWVKEHYRQIDCLVLNAGKSIHRSFYQSLDRYQDVTRTISTNYMSCVQLMMGLIPLFPTGGGQIVVSNAASTLMPSPVGWSAYQASKTAMHSYLCAIRPELQHRGVSLSVLYYPLVRTRMIAPTERYQAMPALMPAEAAERIVSLLCSKRHAFIPWWLRLARPFLPLSRIIMQRIPYGKDL